jgi:hypothetical protein
LHRQLWAWPIIAAVLLGGAGWWVNRSVDNAMRDQRATDLNTLVDASVKAISVWMGEQRINVELVAEDEQIRSMAEELLPLADGTPLAERRLVEAKAQDSMRARMKRQLQLTGYVGYFVVSPDGIVVAADQDPPIAKALTGYRKDVFDRAIAGKTLVTRPFRSPLLLTDEKGDLRAGLPSMFTIGPLRDEKGKTIAALGLAHSSGRSVHPHPAGGPVWGIGRNLCFRQGRIAA